MSYFINFPPEEIDNIIKIINPEIRAEYERKSGILNYEYVNNRLNIRGFNDVAQLNDEDKVADFISFIEKTMQSELSYRDMMEPFLERNLRRYEETLKKYENAKTEEEREYYQGLLYVYEGR